MILNDQNKPHETLMGENKDTATICRGPLKIGAIKQFISDIEWADLDYLVIDSPPGTGDEPLTVAQKARRITKADWQADVYTISIDQRTGEEGNECLNQC